MAQTLAHRLGVRPGDRLLVLNAPERYLRLLEPPPDVHIDLGPIEGAEYDSAHLFALDRGTVDRELHPLLKTLSPAAAVWVCYPRRGGTIITDLGPGKGWDVLVDDGWRPAAQEEIDSDWTALRFTRA